MAYFRNFPIANYYFGDEITPTLFQNITATLKLLDNITDDSTIYRSVIIRDGERPDTLSYRLYGTTDYYYTFFLVNDKLKQKGWPLTNEELWDAVSKYYPHKTLLSEESMVDKFFVNDYVAQPQIVEDDPDTDIDESLTLQFTNPPFKAKIIEKNIDLGQIVVEVAREIIGFTITNPGSGYTNLPTITITGGNGSGCEAVATLNDAGGVGLITVVTGGSGYTGTPIVTIGNPDVDRGDRATATAIVSNYTLANGTRIYSVPGKPDTREWDAEEAERTSLLVNTVVDQYSSVHHYENSNGEWVDLNINEDGGVDNRTYAGLNGKTAITHLNRLISENDDLRQIKVIKPNLVGELDREMQRLLKEQPL